MQHIVPVKNLLLLLTGLARSYGSICFLLPYIDSSQHNMKKMTSHPPECFFGLSQQTSGERWRCPHSNPETRPLTRCRCCMETHSKSSLRLSCCCLAFVCRPLLLPLSPRDGAERLRASIIEESQHRPANGPRQRDNLIPFRH